MAQLIAQLAFELAIGGGAIGFFAFGAYQVFLAEHGVDHSFDGKDFY